VFNVRSMMLRRRVWVGVGAVGTVILGIVLFGEPAHAARLVSVALISADIIGLKPATPA
jgi:quaternary ammonium compound-resistance protein SugE